MKSNYLILIICVILQSACTNDEQVGVEPNPLLQVKEASIFSTGIETRQNTALTKGDIGVYLIATGTYTTTIKNVKYSYATSWSTASPIALLTDPATVCAYYPYGAATITNTTDPASVAIKSQIYKDAEDLCYAKSQTGPTKVDPEVKFSMVHAYAKLTLNITRISTFPGNGVVNNASIEKTGGVLKLSNTLNICTAVYGTALPTNKLEISPGITIAKGQTSDITFLLVPVTDVMSGNMLISLTIDGSKWGLMLDSSIIGTFDAGTNYKIPIILKDNSIYFGKVGTQSLQITTTDWVDKTLNLGQDGLVI